MTESLVPTTRTLIAPKDLYAAMADSWAQLMAGEPCGRASILTMLAQSAFETGWWHYCWDYNLGNVKHIPGDGHDYYQIRCNEYVGGKLVWFDPPHPATWFVSYPDLEAGVRDYLIALRGRFRSAWPYVLAGDPAGFCHALKVAGYYTDDERHYTSNVLGCYHTLDAGIPVDGAIGTQAATDSLTNAISINDRETMPELPDPPDAA